MVLLSNVISTDSAGVAAAPAAGALTSPVGEVTATGAMLDPPAVASCTWRKYAAIRVTATRTTRPPAPMRSEPLLLCVRYPFMASRDRTTPICIDSNGAGARRSKSV
jgi:hypothetical protein